MNLIERYLNGETVSVWKDIEMMGQDAFKPEIYSEVEQVLDETFQRVRFNLEMIYEELLKIDYNFNLDESYNSLKPLNKPLKNANKLLDKLDKMVKPFGYVPVTLKKFYQIVGSCNFGWDYENDENFMWHYSDPIQIGSLDDLVEEMKDNDWVDMMKENVADGEPVYLELAADFYHKDNISGGMAYSIEIAKHPSIDSLFLFEEHKTTFVNYLRICFENCGFSRITNPESKNNYKAFFEAVKPKLKPI